MNQEPEKHKTDPYEAMTIRAERERKEHAITRFAKDIAAQCKGIMAVRYSISETKKWQR